MAKASRHVFDFSQSIEQARFNNLRASNKPSREAICRVLTALALVHDAQVTRKDEPPMRGWHRASIRLAIHCHGVGASVSIDDLHGGYRSLISWFNTEHPARDFTPRFIRAVGDAPRLPPHHKATSFPPDWFSLVAHLSGGLVLASRDQAFT